MRGILLPRIWLIPGCDCGNRLAGPGRAGCTTETMRVMCNPFAAYLVYTWV